MADPLGLHQGVGDQENVDPEAEFSQLQIGLVFGFWVRLG
jgi:hypothetical protein